MGIVDVNKKKEEVLAELFDVIKERINEFYENECGFTVQDLLKDSPNNDYYRRYMTKGILITLLYKGDLKIIALVNGNKNYVFYALNKLN